MTPAPPPAPAKYALPIVALVLSIVGLCMPCLALVGGILGIVAWVRIGKEPHLPNKGLAIAATFIPLATIPMIGVYAAIAIPNFIRFQARAKQAECRSNLRALAVGAKSFHDEKGSWPTALEDTGFSPEPGNRYSYFLTPTAVHPADARRWPGVEAEDRLGALARAGVIPGATGDAFTVACVGNIDNDRALDVWSASFPARPGDAVAGSPRNDVNDVTEN